jgi:hypothetical protein
LISIFARCGSSSRRSCSCSSSATRRWRWVCTGPIDRRLEAVARSRSAAAIFPSETSKLALEQGRIAASREEADEASGLPLQRRDLSADWEPAHCGQQRRQARRDGGPSRWRKISALGILADKLMEALEFGELTVDLDLGGFGMVLTAVAVCASGSFLVGIRSESDLPVLVLLRAVHPRSRNDANDSRLSLRITLVLLSGGLFAGDRRSSAHRPRRSVLRAIH